MPAGCNARPRGPRLRRESTFVPDVLLMSQRYWDDLTEVEQGWPRREQGQRR